MWDIARSLIYLAGIKQNMASLAIFAGKSVLETTESIAVQFSLPLPPSELRNRSFPQDGTTDRFLYAFG